MAKRKSIAADFRKAKAGGTGLTADQKNLRKLIQKAKRKGVTIGSARQTGTSRKVVDRELRALPPGWRISKTGNLYFESRKNRSDKRGSTT